MGGILVLAVIVVAMVLVVVMVLAVSLRKKSGPKTPAWPLKAKPPLSVSEIALFTRLQEALPEHVVLAQVTMTAIMEVAKGKEHQWALNKIAKKSLDFVVCDKAMKVHGAIELDGKSHDRKRQMERDSDKEAALNAAGIKLVRFNSAVLPKGPEIRESLGINSIH